MTARRPCEIGTETWARRAAERAAAIAREVRSGRARADVAAGFGVSPDTVYRACRRHGVPLGGRRSRGPEVWSRQAAARRAAIARAVRAGRSIEDAAARHGVGTTTVYRACREHGVALDGPEARAARRHREMAGAVRGGAPVAEVARRFGVSGDTVRLACRRHGVEAPRAVMPSRARALRARAGLAGARPPAPRRPRGRWPDAARRMAEVARLLAETELTYAQIGARCGVTRQRVGQVMRGLRGR